MKVYEWAKDRKSVAKTETQARLELPSPGYHKWTGGEVDALKYAVEKLPANTSLAEFVGAIVPGEDCRDSVVTILAKERIGADPAPASKGAKVK